MKNIKLFIFALFIPLMFSVLNVYATENLTIDDKSYDETTGLFIVSGTTTYDEVMVSLFFENNLLSFKTVSASEGQYTARFYVTFSTDRTITIKVGDINSNSYKTATLDVLQSNIRNITLIDDGGNSLTILNSLHEFADNEFLDIEFVDVNGVMDANEEAAAEVIQNALGTKRILKYMMFISVRNPDEAVELEELNRGYRLFLNAPPQYIDGYTRPFMARITDFTTFEVFDDQEFEYDDEAQGFVFDLDNVGLYVIYDDTSILYDDLDDTDDQTYDLADGDTLTIRVDADYAKFLNVYVDDVLVDSSNYTSKSGSTIITFKKSYLQSLSVGSHRVRVDFTDGEANLTLNVVDSANPLTHDGVMKYMILLLIGVVGFTVFGSYFKRKNLSNN